LKVIKLKSKRYHSLDAMRGLLMLLGVYFHVAAFHYLESNPLTYNKFVRKTFIGEFLNGRKYDYKS